VVTLTVVIEALTEGTGIRIDDRIERRRFSIYTPDWVTPEETGYEFPYPVDATAAVETSELTLPQVPTAYVRTPDGEVVARVESGSQESFPRGEYLLDLSGPMKLYVHVESPLSISADSLRTVVSFSDVTVVTLGARSYHRRPANTITTTDDPRDVMRAISMLGSALKSTTYERSYPTLRGHPPAIELGDQLHIPDSLEAPDTGTRIEVPPTLENVLVIGSLAYYLGARVVPGTQPRLVTDTGFVHDLVGPNGLEAEVERVLKQTFLFDCLTRTAATPNLTLFEHRVLDVMVDIDFAELAEVTSAERLAAYLTVPYDIVEPYVPEWKLTSHVEPEPTSVEVLPYLVDDLAVIKTPMDTGATAPTGQVDAVDAFMRISEHTQDIDGFVRGKTRSATEDATNPTIIRPEQTTSIEQAWVGENAPVGASKAIPEAYKNRLERQESDGDIDIVVVCNDPEMLEEHETVQNVYGSRDELPFDVTFYDSLDRERLRFVLESDIDFLHYIGHIDDSGFQCPDGMLDAKTLDSVGVDAFFLNACRSYQQGIELLRAGAIAGVVTLDDVINSGAIRVGETMARLLNRGFPLRAALNIAAERSIIGSHYIVVGDGNFDIAHAESLMPNLVEITERDGLYHAKIRTYPIGTIGLGAVWWPFIGDNDECYLVGSRHMEFTVTADQLLEYLEMETCPVRIGTNITWSNEITKADL
jgi:hypothetical protein